MPLQMLRFAAQQAVWMRGSICLLPSYGTARREISMYFPDARRLAAADAKEYFLKVVKPRLPDPKAMPNDGEDTVFRYQLSEESLVRLARNIRVTVMRAF